MSILPRFAITLGGLALTGSGLASVGLASQADVPWAFYHADPGGSHYSRLDQINTRNVARLQQVWRFDAGSGGLQTTPLVIGQTLYAYTTDQQVIALDAATGVQRWIFSGAKSVGQTPRGLTWWSNGRERRLFASVRDGLYALDPDSGQPIASFGEGGRVDLRKDLLGASRNTFFVMTSPGAIYRDLIITGFRTSEGHPAASGAIRAYDVHTGQLRWTFRTIPRPGEAGHETWPEDAWKTAGGANNWAGMVVDEPRGIVFAPTGSAVDDFWGGDRKGDNRYANSLLALDAATGKLLWHFQGVHHDISDRDFPSPPVLVTVKHSGKPIDAVAQTTKQGYVFVFDRVTGKPLFPIEERAIPASTVPGEAASPSQPYPLAPKPFTRQRLTADLLTTRTPEAHAAALKQFAEMASGGPFEPIRLNQPTAVFPGLDGGAEWGGAAVDPSGVLYVNANEMAWSGMLVPRNVSNTGSVGATVYEGACASCHGLERRGSPPAIPSLVEIGKRMDAKAIDALLDTGRGRMPVIALSQEYRRPLYDFLLGASATSAEAALPVPDSGPQYRYVGYRKFLDIDGYPAIKPPWGTLNAIDLNSGRYLWSIPFGEYPELAAKGLRNTGSENYGGPIITAGGLLLIAATNYDCKIRAFDRRNGRLLWQAELPFAGNATPITYRVGGRQFIVVAASSEKNPKGPKGAAYVAFALPNDSRGGREP